jgi:protein TonB
LPGNPDAVRNYINAVMRQLHRHKTYPRELKKAKVEGTVVLEFTIDRDGRLCASSVQRSSGSPELDRAALDMLARADPLPAIPDFMNRDELALAIPVEYSLITDR